MKHVSLNQKRAIVATIQLGKGDTRLELFWKQDQGVALKTFQALESWLSPQKKTLVFAANGGIYRDTPSTAPIGLHVENGRILTRLNFAKECGNFCWYSGVFLIHDDLASIFPREDATSRNFSGARLAFQSGPIFMRSGDLQGSWSRFSYNLNRSAICTTTKPGEVILVLVTDSTNFGEFFAAVKQAGCRDALFLDGNVSSFYEGKSRKRTGNEFETYAGILAVTESD